MNKKVIRKEAITNRKFVDNIKSSVLVTKMIIDSNILDDFTNIGIYFPIGKEIDITGLENYYKDKKFYLPKTIGDVIEFSLDDGNLIDGLFKTKEPITKTVNRDLIECFLIPCVAISKTKKRIGYGKGYYDRYLDGYKGLKIGICYKNAAFMDVTCDVFDVTLDEIFLG